MAALREILAQFDIKVNDKQLEGLTSKISGTVESLKAMEAQTKQTVFGFDKLAKVAAGLFALKKIGEWTFGLVETERHTEEISQKLGMGVEQLKAWRYAAGQAGVETEQMELAFKHLNRHIGEFGKRKFVDKMFGIAGSALGKTNKEMAKNADGTFRSASDVMLDLADAMEKIKDPAEQTAVAMALLNRTGAGVLPLIKHGSGPLREMLEDFQRLGQSPKDFTENSVKADRQMRRFSVSARAMANTLINKALPWVTERLQEFANWLPKATETVSKFIDSTTALKDILLILGGIALVKATMALRGFAAAMGLATWQLTVVAVAVATVTLLFLDLFHFLKGDANTALGDIFGQDAGVKFIESLRTTWLLFKQDVQDGVRTMKEAIDSLIMPIVHVTKALALLAEGNFSAASDEISRTFNRAGAGKVGTGTVSDPTEKAAFLNNARNLNNPQFFSAPTFGYTPQGPDLPPNASSPNNRSVGSLSSDGVNGVSQTNSIVINAPTGNGKDIASEVDKALRQLAAEQAAALAAATTGG